LFRHSANAKKWCEIHHTSGHDLEECRTYLDRKKKEDEPMAPEPQRGDRRGPTPTTMNSSMKSMSSSGAACQSPPRPKEKKLEQKINLAHQIVPGRRMKWSDTNISFRPEDHH
jgi:hypothetical protein